MIFGIDVSKYQSVDQLAALFEQGQSFVIVNVDDPTLSAKVEVANAYGKPWGTYKWVYPGANLTADASSAVIRTRQLGEPPLGIWWDYEEDGVSQNQLVDAFKAADALGMKSGYYSNGWRVDHGLLTAQVGWRPYWYCGYPGNNDGSFPGIEQMSVYRDTQIWQFSSSNGNLDVNVVIDESWYANWVGASVSTPQNKKGRYSVLVVNHGVGKSALTDGGLIVREFTGAPGTFGVPQDALDFQTSSGCPSINATDGEWLEFEKRTKASGSGGVFGLAYRTMTDGSIEAAVVSGDVFVLAFSGAPGFLGLPVDAIEYGVKNAVSWLPEFNNDQWTNFQRRTYNSLNPTGGEQTPAVDLAPVKSALADIGRAVNATSIAVQKATDAIG